MKTISTNFCTITKASFVLFLILCMTSPAAAQIIPLVNNFRANWQIINPAAINFLQMQDGRKDAILDLTARKQWLQGNVEGAPVFSTVRYEYYQKNNDPQGTRFKFGGFGIAGRAGAITSYKIQGNFAAILPIDYRGSSFSLGANVGWAGNSFDLEDIKFASGRGSVSYLPGELLTQSFFDASVGVFYRKVFSDDMNINDDSFIKEFFIGFSVPQINIPFLDLQEPNTVRIRPETNLSLIAGASFPILRNCNCTEPSFLEASLWVRQTPSLMVISPYDELSDMPISADVYLKAQYRNLLWIGGGYGSQGMVHTEVGGYFSDSSNFFLSNISFTYSFPAGVNSPFMNFLEVNLGFAWKQN